MVEIRYFYGQSIGQEAEQSARLVRASSDAYSMQVVVDIRSFTICAVVESDGGGFY